MIKLSIIVFILLTLIPISNAIQLDINHKTVYCFNCHGINGYYVGEKEDEYCGNCHNLYFENNNFKYQHEKESCKGCHKITTKESFHSKHINNSCITCHINNTLPDNPYNECISCHISGLHPIHLNKKCELCHANVVSQKQISKIIPKSIKQCNDEEDCWDTIIQEINTSKETKSINNSKSIINYKKFTIYEIFKNLLNKISDDIYGLQ